MTRKQLILDRYEVIGIAGAGGFGTVQIAWDPRIQRKVAIKTIQLTERDAKRAAISGAQNGSDESVNHASDEGDSADANGARTTVLLEEERVTRKALSPAEARSAREKAQAQAQEEIRARSQAWETPWVQIPSNIDTSELSSGESESMLEAEAFDEVDELDRTDTSERSLSDHIPPVVQVPKVDERDRPASQSFSLPTIDLETSVETEASSEITAEIPVIETEDSTGDDQLDQSEFDETGLDDMSADAATDIKADSYRNDYADDYVKPTDIIAEARASLKGLSVSEPLPPSPRDEEPITSLVHVPGLDEARTAAKLSDPRIVTVYDFEVRDQTAYLIMEYVEGITLSRLLDDYPDYITLDMVTGVFDAVSGALEIAHDAGVLHLDIKPDNIIINKDGQVKVTDFGLATLADAAGHGFAGGGTIGYMPLEQMHREELDVRTDEWALASMTYEMLTGGNPFRARNLEQAEQAILNAELILPSLCWPRVDPQIDDVLFYALDPDREERYENIEDFADEVTKFLGDPDSGQEQLALVVEDALSTPEVEPEEPTADARDHVDESGQTGLLGFFKRLGRSQERQDHTMAQRRSARDRGARDGARGAYPEFAPSDRLAEKLGKYGPDDALYEDDYYYEDEEDAEPTERLPLNQRVPDRVVTVAARLFNGIGCAFVSGLTFWNFEPLRSIPDAGPYIGALIGALIFGALGMIVPVYGALVSFCLLGLVVCICGHPIVGAILIIATALWWYVVGRDGMAENNIALLGPLSMTIGAASITPLFAGVSLKPLQAAITMLYSVVLVCVFASFGGSSLMGWETFGFPTLSDTDVTLSFARMFARPLTLTMAAGWIIGATLFALLDMKSKRWMFILGVIVCAACVLTGTLIFTAPTPQLIVSVLVAVALLLAVFV